MNPYENLPAKAFWKLSVANKSPFDLDELWDPKFAIQPGHHVVTFGSCFAQHIGSALKARGFNWLSTETPPHGLSEQNARLLNYNIFSARTGNIYTTSLLRQWTNWAVGESEPAGECWQKDSRFFDPFRPRIEPNGFISEAEMKQSQAQAVRSFRASITKADYFIFTLGLTESWISEDGYEYPMCPGTVAGDFDPEKHKFKNQEFQEILADLEAAILLMQQANPALKFVLTVSPVPLTATKSNKHVLVATTESKAILRAVAGQLAAHNSQIDYFPAFEIINGPTDRGVFFAPNQRSVTPDGVNLVTETFFKCLESKFGMHQPPPNKPLTETISADEICEEELLEAFARGG